MSAWNGGPSNVDKSFNDDNHRNDSQDEYDEEFDKGKVYTIHSKHLFIKIY